MPMIFGAGVLLAILFYVITAALHLLNQPSDAAVAAGYLIVLLLVSLAAGLLWRRHN
jgi:hypothetical protein